MHSKAIPRSDRAVQRAVLALALAAHPERLTIPTIARDFEHGEAERAVRDLVGAGLLECSGLSVSASDAALRHDGLELP